MGSHGSVIVVAVTFLLLLHRLALQLESAEDDLFFSARCHPFECGNLNNISYPFSNSQHPECGLSVIHCDEYNRPIIYFDFGGESKRYEVEAIHDNNNTIVIRHFPDGDQDGGVEEAACHLHSFTTPTFSNLVTTLLFQVISPNLTLVTCSYNTEYSPPKEIVNQFFEYTYYCPGRGALHAFYQNGDPKQGRSLSYVSKDFCSVFQIPVHNLLPPLSDSVNKTDDHLSPLLHAGFSLKWSFPPECHECDVKGVPCRRDPLTSTVECANINNGSSAHWIIKTATGVGIGIVVSFILVICFLARKLSSDTSTIHWKKRGKNCDDVEDFFKNYGSLAPKRYSYSQVKEMTNSFKDKLGQGGFGGVYKGKLLDGRVVAVKVPSETKGNNGEEFINEVASISRTSHVNVHSFRFLL